MKAKTDRQLLDHARSLYQRKRWRESLEAHLKLVANGAHASHGFYGIALIRLAHGDLATARIQLLNCVRLQPGHAHAQFYLGEIARMRGENAVAIARYRLAVAAQPSHRSARERLASLEHSKSAPKSHARNAPRHSASTHHDRAKRRQKAFQLPAPNGAELLLARIKALSFLGRQRLAPFAGQLVLRWLIALALVIVATVVFRGWGDSPRRVSLGELLPVLVICTGGLFALWWIKDRAKLGRLPLVLGSLLAASLALFQAGALTGFLVAGSRQPGVIFFLHWLFTAAVLSVPLILAIRAKVVVIRDGWIRIAEGVFRRNTTPIPLYRVQAVTVSRSGLGGVLGEADLAIQYTNEAGQSAAVNARGVGRLEGLRTVADQATAIANDLRAGQWRSGLNSLWRPGISFQPLVRATAAAKHADGPRRQPLRNDAPHRREHK